MSSSRYHRVSPDSRVLLFTGFPERAAVAPALAAAACGLPVKDAGGTAVRDAIRSVVRTGTFRAERSVPSVAPVTARERCVSSSLTGLIEPDGMHTTPTVGYGIVLRGEIVLELDDGQCTPLTAGDVVIENGTRYAWHEVCRRWGRGPLRSLEKSQVAEGRVDPVPREYEQPVTVTRRGTPRCRTSRSTVELPAGAQRQGATWTSSNAS
jgi:hypothetical protein